MALIKMKYCPNCGTEAKEMRYCSSCGANLQAENSLGYQPQPKSQVIAFILCLFLGEFGAHRFYVGKIGTGILMLLFTVPSVVVFIYTSTALEMSEIYGKIYGRSSDPDVVNIVNTITTISAVVMAIFGIWILIDLIRIITGSFLKEQVNSNNRGSTIFVLVLVALMLLISAFGIYYTYSKNRLVAEAAKYEAEAKAAAAMEAYRAQRTADSLAREDSIKKKKKASDFSITPKQIEHTLKIQKSTEPLKGYKMQKEK